MRGAKPLAVVLAAALLAAGLSGLALADPSPSTSPSTSPSPSHRPSPSPSRRPPSPSPSPSSPCGPTPSPFTGNPELTPPPTPIPPFNCPSPFPTVLVTPPPSVTVPPTTARSYVLEDMATGQVLAARGGAERVPIASVTKIMTAQLVLARGHLGAPMTVSEAAASQIGAGLGLKAGEVDSVYHLLYGMLLASANDAAYALGQHEAGGSAAAFVRMMNARARRLGMARTHFLSPSGLNDHGYSTAEDVATMTRAAFRFPLFRKMVQSKTVDIPGPFGQGVRHIQNRNVLLWLYPGDLGVKTGFTSAAGWCMVAVAKRDGLELISVALGDPTEQASFDDAAALLNYGFAAFSPRTVLRTGQSVGTVHLQGGAVPAVAGKALRALVNGARVGSLRTRLVPVGGISLPVHRGEVLGRVEVLDGNLPVGWVPAVAREFVPAPPIPPGALPLPFLGRADRRPAMLARAARTLGGMLRAAFGGFL